jgi:hypothetical protein
MYDKSFAVATTTRVDVLSVLTENLRRQERATIKAEASNSPNACIERLALGRLALDLFDAYVEVGILPRAPATGRVFAIEYGDPGSVIDEQVISFLLSPEALDASAALEALDGRDNPPIIPANGFINGTGRRDTR